MFVYTKNEDVIKMLENDGCKLIKVQDNGIRIYALSPTSKFSFSEQVDTKIMNTLTL